MRFKINDTVVCIEPDIKVPEGAQAPQYGRIYKIRAVGLFGRLLLEENGIRCESWKSDYFIHIKEWSEATRAVILLKIELGFNCKTI